jgi:8-oxo-dGTP pyrophosphatase MutT (NUDIX family)
MSKPVFDAHPAAGDVAWKVRGRRAVRPRDAATLILVRRDGPVPRVLMGRRHRGHDFMPDKWVFPGGRVEPADARAPFATDLRSEVSAKLKLTAPDVRARALAMAAVRETFEEAGLLLARSAPARSASGPWREFLAQGAQPDLAALDFVARAITPPVLPKRFDARFFMADAERLVSLDRQKDCGELDEIDWLSINDALATPDVAGITKFVLRETAARLSTPERGVPFLRFVQRTQVVTHL